MSIANSLSDCVRNIGHSLTHVKGLSAHVSEPVSSGVYPGAGDRIAQLVRKGGWTKKALADAAGVSRETVHQALHDRLSGRTATLLAKVFDTTAEFILTGQVSQVRERSPSPYRSPTVSPRDEFADEAGSEAGRELEGFVGEMDRLVRTLSSTTAGALPVEAKIAILNGFEEAARVAGRKLPPEYWDIRRRVVEQATDGEEGAGGEADTRR